MIHIINKEEIAIIIDHLAGRKLGRIVPHLRHSVLFTDGQQSAVLSDPFQPTARGGFGMRQRRRK